MDPMTRPAELDETLLQAVDDALLVLGKSARVAIYECIEKSYQVRREEIPDKVLTFHRALQDLLGSGAKIMERRIARDLYSRLGLDFTEHHNWTLIDFMHHAKKVRRHA
jgi:hypothetical protein